MRTPNPRWPACFRLLTSLAAALLAAPLSVAQFIPSTPGTYDFNNPANWTGGVINGQFSGDLNAIWTTTATDLTLGGFSWNHTGLTGASPSLRADGTGDRTLTINNGTITLTTGSGFLTAMLGNGLAGSRLFVDLAGTTSISTPTNTVFSLQNDATFSGAITKTGVGRIDTFGNVNVSGSLALNSGTLNVGGGVLSVTGSLTLGSGAYLELFSNGSLSGNVSTASGSSVSFNNNADQTYSGVISGGGSLLKYGTGVLTLSENNVMTGGHTGATNINAGTLRITGAYAQLGGSVVNVSSGATLDVQNNLILGGGLNGAGNVTLGAGATLNVGSSGGSFSGQISGAGALSSGGNLTLGGNNTYSGGTNLWGNTVTVTHNSALGTGAIQFSGGGLAASGTRVIANPYTVSSTVRFGGAGFLTLTHDATLTGTPVFDVTNIGITTLSGVLDGTGSLTKTGSGILTLSGANTYSGGTSINAGLIEFSSLGNFGSGTIALNGGGLYWASGTTTDVTPQLNTVLGGTGGTLHTNSNNISFGVSFSGIGAGLTKNGLGTLTLTGASTYTGATTINAGTLVVGATNALPTATALNVVQPAGTLAVSQDQAVSSLAGAGAVQIDSGRVFTVNGTSSTIFSGALSGDGSLVKTGTSQLTLTGANAHTGGTTVQGGTLSIGNSGTTGSVAGAIAVSSGATLAFRRSDSVTHAGVISGAGAVSYQGAGVLTLSGANTYSGGTTLAGTGSGTLAITASSNLGATSGGITFNSGMLRSDANVTLAHNITLASGMRFVNTNGNNLELSGVISGPGGLTKSNSAGTLTLSGANTYTGATQIQGGILATGAAYVLPSTTAVSLLNGTSLLLNHNQAVNFFNATATAAVTLAGATTLSFNGGGFNGVVSGAGGLIKTGSSTATLAAANTYTGDTVVNGGTLRIVSTGGSGTGTGSVLVKNTAILRGAGIVSGDVTVESGGLLSGGSVNPGTFTLGDVFLKSGAAIEFRLKDTLGLSGDPNGYNLLALSGVLDLAGTPGDPLRLALASNNAAGAAGLAANFDPGANATFLVATAAGGITGFAANAWTIDTALFQNSFNGSFSLSQTGNSLYLNYAAIPEPSTYAALAGALALGLAAWRRRTAA